MERVIRSFSLVGQSFRILMADKEMMVLPIVSGVITVSIVVITILGFGISPEAIQRRDTVAVSTALGMSILLYAIGIFFQGAVVAGAIERIRGGNPTIESALRAVTRRIGAILLWAVVAATIGLVLRMIAERSGLLGKLGIAVMNLAWSLSTLFVVPVLVLEELSVSETFYRSAELFTDTWGETVVGNIGLGAAATAAWLVLVGLSLLAASTSAGFVGGLVVFVPGALVISVVFSTLEGVFLASLYEFATTGRAAGFDRDLLKSAYVQS